MTLPTAAAAFGYIAPMNSSSAGHTLGLKQILVCGAMIVTLSMGIRHGFGL